MKKYTLIVWLLVMNITFGPYLCGMQATPKNNDAFANIQYCFVPKKVTNKINEIMQKRSSLWLAIQKIVEMKGLESPEAIEAQVVHVNNLLDSQVDINERNYFFTFKKNIFGGRWVEIHEGSLLHMVALCGNKALTRGFLAREPLLDVKNEDGLPAIFFSVAQNDEETTRLLVQEGAKTDFPVITRSWMHCGKLKMTPLDEWTSNKNIKRLLKAIQVTV